MPALTIPAIPQNPEPLFLVIVVSFVGVDDDAIDGRVFIGCSGIGCSACNGSDDSGSSGAINGNGVIGAINCNGLIGDVNCSGLLFDSAKQSFPGCFASISNGTAAGFWCSGAVGGASDDSACKCGIIYPFLSD